jgi:hypothetical protein
MSGVSLLASKLKKKIPSEATPQLQTNSPQASPPRVFGVVSIHSPTKSVTPELKSRSSPVATALARSVLVEKIFFSSERVRNQNTLRSVFQTWKFQTQNIRSSRCISASLLSRALHRWRHRLLREVLLRFISRASEKNLRRLVVVHGNHLEISRRDPRDFDFSRFAVAAVYRPPLQRHIDHIIRILAE